MRVLTYDWWLWWLMLALLLSTSNPPLPVPLSMPSLPALRSCSTPFSDSVVVVPPDQYRSTQLVAVAAKGYYKPMREGLKRIGGVRTAPPGTIRVGPAPQNATLTFRIELAIKDEMQLYAWLNHIYRRGHSQYHQYYKPGEFAKLHEHSPHEKRAIVQHLEKAGITTLNQVGRWLRVSGQVHSIDALFHTGMALYKGDFIAPTYDAQVHKPLEGIIAIHHLDTIVRKPRRARAQPFGGVGDPQIDDYSYMRMMYNVPFSLNGAGQTVGIVGEPILLSDIQQYEATYMAGTYVNASVTFVSVYGAGTTPGSGSAGIGQIETTLDVTSVITMAPAAAVVVYCSSDSNIDGLNQMAVDQIVTVASTSFGSYDDPSAMASVLAQLAVEGVTFFSATGDGGCGTYFDPADQPLCTGVGGTYMGSNWQYASVISNLTFPGESPWTPQSTGGISAFNLPSWQTSAAEGNPQASLQYRNVPDVSAWAGTRSNPHYVIIVTGSADSLSGTSAASPLWAGMTAVLNQNQVNLGLPLIGFFNPLLYEIANSSYYNWALRDMNDGSTNSNGNTCSFTALDGYDLVTGLGSPNLTNLMYAVTTLTSCGVLQTPVLTSGSMPLQTSFFETRSGMFGLGFVGPQWINTVYRGSAITNAGLQLAPAAAFRLGQSYSIMFWALVTQQTNGYPTILVGSHYLGNANSFWVMIPTVVSNSAAQIAFGHGSNVGLQQASYTPPSSTPLLGSWVHIGVVYDSIAPTASIYLNGTMRVSTAGTFISSWVGGGQMMMGGGNSGVAYSMIGSLQCLQWGGVVSASAVQSVYNSQLPGGCAGG